jgi:hypothetical protein
LIYQPPHRRQPIAALELPALDLGGANVSA